MSDLFLPRSVDNSYRGSRVALWLLALLALLKIAMGLNCIFNGQNVATSADGIPLDSFSPAAARVVVALFASWGLGQLLLGLLGALVLLRYRALTSFLFALLLFEQLSRKLIHLSLPIERAGTPPGSTVNLLFLLLMAVGLALSLWRRPDRLPAG